MVLCLLGVVYRNVSLIITDLFALYICMKFTLIKRIVGVRERRQCMFLLKYDKCYLCRACFMVLVTCKRKLQVCFFNDVINSLHLFVFLSTHHLI